MPSATRWWRIRLASSGSEPGWFSGVGYGQWRWLSWSRPELSFLSVMVDDVVWKVVVAFESVALVSMLGFFFIFYGCTV
ncbi:hypothetical protein BRARA_F02818 [Brassica rapa]|uniref:Uncharacterized protein n=2 Tax=Brassica TaxID=3705 RepID=A0A397Z1P3_BRACM|nr:uncharacterized protein BNAA06G28330D [Brassica napus]XP_033129763.1 uncharacterized protein LOC103874485 [Brassica rapa]RID59597.1 hypothetical protein BRARA_F02818 [Brassica rapa]CAF2089242.1 unnamed protein product [Brassica napus]CAG7872222.1 unnamed protein product [Brassica rapa]VDC68087.1 unnamed protein product [Brassica rapa]